MSVVASIDQEREREREYMSNEDFIIKKNTTMGSDMHIDESKLLALGSLLERSSPWNPTGHGICSRNLPSRIGCVIIVITVFENGRE